MHGTIAVIREKGKETSIISARELSDKYAAFFNYVSEKRICFTGYDQVIQDEKDRRERIAAAKAKKAAVQTAAVQDTNV